MRRIKLIRRYSVTSAAPHDSQETDNLLDPSNSSGDVWADSAYRSKAREEPLAQDGYRSHMHRRAARGHALSERAQEANTRRSRTRARIEHIFGDQTTAMGGKIVRTIGFVRAKAKIGMMNLAYHMRRLVTLERLAGRCA